MLAEMKSSEEIKDIPYVAVFMVTYNHEQYIRQAIEGVIMQMTNFKIRLYIGEDCSKDNTKGICLSYAEKYPEIITLICTEVNNLSVNIENIWRATLSSGAKYIAFCEGDDYWIDNLKLQKQVDFLDANPDYSMCFSDFEIIDELGWNWPAEKFIPKMNKNTYTIDDFILSMVSIVPTASLFIRNLLPNPLPAFWEAANGGDLIVHLLIADKGKAKYMDEKMAIYRNHAGGITKSEWAQLNENKEPLLKKTFECVNEYLNFKYDKVFRERFFEMSKIQLIYGSRNKKGIEKLKYYFKTIPDYIRYSKRINFKELVYYHLILFAPSLLKLFKK